MPSPELQALNDDILRQHPDLGWERPSTSARTVEGFPTGTVTFLFTDLEGSTRLWEEHADAMASALARHNEIVRDAVETNGGFVVKTTGDGFHAAFANASEALDAAVAAQRALQAEPWPETVPLRARMGVHTGEANRRDGDYYGPALNHAARLMGIAHGGQIVCSGIVAHLTGGTAYELEDLGLHRLRDVDSAMQVFQVNAPDLESRFAPLESLDAYRSNLPRELSGFVGRTDDVIAVSKALAEARVVSIVGVGGAGKTRLALRVGSSVLTTYPDGVWWCELAGVRDPDAVLEAVAAALGYAPSLGASMAEGLAAFFRHKELLLVLDNCEHLLSPVGALVRTLCEAAPRLSVLATSREALAIAGERTYPLPALQLPLDSSPFSVESSEAGQLFVARARDVRGSFVVTEENSAAIAELCVHLDGNALAIELAAARTALMTPAEILARLGERFRFLKSRSGDSPERHQTLHAAIDWSYALLDTGEQTLLQWLSVFVGDFDLAAVTALGIGAGLDEFDTVERLGSLVAKSLVERTETDGGSRYRLLETIRQYAAEWLATEGDTDRARDAHAAHYAATGGALFAQYRTPLDFEALEQLRIETPNLAAGLRRLIESGHVADVLRFFDGVGFMDSGLVPFVLMDELGRVANEALDRHGTSNAPGYVATLAFSGLRAFQLGDLERYQHVVAAAHEADPDSVLMVGAAIGAAAMGGDLAGGIAIGRAGIERARTAGDPRMLSWLLSLVSLSEIPVDPAAALAHVEESVEIAHSLPASSALVYPLCQLSIVLRAVADDPERALAAAEECIRLDRSHRKVWTTISEGAAAMLRVDRGDVASGLRMWADVLHRFDWSGEVGYLSMQLPGGAEALADIDPTFALDLAAIADCGVISKVAVAGFEWFTGLVDELGADAIEAARGRAASMSYDDAVTYIFDNIERLIAEAD
jgi:predicted ATPase/class 3 adenylate cyclase